MKGHLTGVEDTHSSLVRRRLITIKCGFGRSLWGDRYGPDLQFVSEPTLDLSYLGRFKKLVNVNVGQRGSHLESIELKSFQ